MDSFVVSARKYRPATFASVVGQGHITSTLKNAIARSQLAHAYLFCGPRGVGKTTCARIFAKAINCLSPLDSEACNECESCRSFNEGRSFNIHELDAASNNSVDDIRNLTDQVRIPPQIGRYSVYIIDEVHMLSAAAFNAFLKTLEEPPAHAIFILATTEKHKIIPTILSRCQIFDFNRIRVEDGVGYLKYIAGQEGVAFDDESLHIIAQKADGGMRDALSMFDKAVSFCGKSLTLKEVARTLNILDYDSYFTVVSHLVAGDYKAALLDFDEILGKGFSGQTFVTGLNSHLRDVLMCKSPDTLSLLEVSGTLLDRYRRQGDECDAEFLFGAISLLTAIDGTLKTSYNQRLSIELGLMKLARLGQKKNGPIGSFERFELPEIGGEPVSQQAKAAPVPMPAPLPEEKPAPVSMPAPKPEKQGAPISISGASIASILNQKPATVEAEEGAAEVVVDPDSERKILAAREAFIAELNLSRPRMAMAFTNMEVAGNIVSIVAANESLHDEIMRNRTELLTALASAAGIDGVLELRIEVREDKAALKPIKVEDKLRFLTEKNPLLATLRRELDLEIE
ncbi:MAG: DNA polymerase III subunit gamma/tau [Rikenellaceae bacterium]|jgi:DNA polymerase-3 subunit gamma/tau|nr:DNA polymerase III subunit gamma/tau [Rikenellaceae bacterium]